MQAPIPVLWRVKGTPLQCLYGTSGATAQEETRRAHKYYGVDSADLSSRTALVKADVLAPLLEFMADPESTGQHISKETLSEILDKYAEHWSGAPLPMGESLLQNMSQVVNTDCILQVGQCPIRADRGACSTALYSVCSNEKFVNPIATAMADVSGDPNRVTTTIVSDEARCYCTELTYGMPVVGADGTTRELETDEERYEHAGCWNSAKQEKRGMMYWNEAWQEAERLRIAIIIAIAACLRMNLVHILCYGTMSAELITGTRLSCNGAHESKCSEDFYNLFVLEAVGGCVSLPPVTLVMHWSWWVYAVTKNEDELYRAKLASTYHFHNEIVLRRVSTSLPALQSASSSAITAMLEHCKSSEGCDLLDNIQSESDCSPLKLSDLLRLGYGDTCFVDSEYNAGIYVNNAKNRKLRRVGLPRGTAVQHRDGSVTWSDGNTSVADSSGVGVYVDNAKNRKLGRVGLPRGTAVLHRNGSMTWAGGHLPSRVHDNKATITTSERQAVKQDDCERIDQPIFEPEGKEDYVSDRAEGIINRHGADSALTMHKLSGVLEPPSRVEEGQVIDYAKDIQLGKKLGSGAFGDVYVATCKGKYTVAVKKLSFERLTPAQKEKIQQEVVRLSSLNHPAVITFYGVCVVPPDLAIIMELMPVGSLYDVLHIEERQLQDAQKYGMASDMLSGLTYLHSEGVVHRDIKSMHVMACVGFSHCKLACFGFAFKDESTSSSSVADYTALGTYRYCPAEVLEGLNLTIEQFKIVDVYAVALTITELYTETEPYKGMNVHQIQRAVKSGESAFSEEAGLPTSVQTMLQNAMHKDVSRRPTAEELFNGFQKSKAALLGPSIGASVGVRA